MLLRVGRFCIDGTLGTGARYLSSVSKTKNERAIFRCALNPSDARVLEVPQWMFDAATCSRMRLSVVPSISVRSLCELTQLLSMIGSPRILTW